MLEPIGHMNYRPICDTWILARSKVKYYGAYPAGFLGRARTMLGVGVDDAVLHVCAGRVKDYPYNGFGPDDMTLDVDPATVPDFIQDARDPFPLRPDRVNGLFGDWGAVLIDPPYTLEDAKRYGDHPLPTANELLRNGLRVVRPRGRVGILHYLWPSPPKEARSVAAISVLVGFNNRVRLFSVFERT